MSDAFGELIFYIILSVIGILICLAIDHFTGWNLTEHFLDMLIYM